MQCFLAVVDLMGHIWPFRARSSFDQVEDRLDWSMTAQGDRTKRASTASGLARLRFADRVWYDFDLPYFDLPVRFRFATWYDLPTISICRAKSCRNAGLQKELGGQRGYLTSCFPRNPVQQTLKPTSPVHTQLQSPYSRMADTLC